MAGKCVSAAQVLGLLNLFLIGLIRLDRLAKSFESRVMHLLVEGGRWLMADELQWGRALRSNGAALSPPPPSPNPSSSVGAHMVLVSLGLSTELS